MSAKKQRPMPGRRLPDKTPQNQSEAALVWAFLHPPTREAYMRSTGEDVGAAIDRFREWVEENLVGSLRTSREEAR